MPKLSVIVPLYNSEKYLCKCVDSILDQSYSDFELILVDDGSSDSCGDICDRYAETDDRIIVIHQKNTGVSAARNAGIERSRGELVSFVDSDDFLHPQMYDIMITAITESGSDIGICNFQAVGEEGCACSSILKSGYTKLSAEEYIAKLYDMPPTIFNSCCNKIFNRKCLREKFDIEHAICEDAKFLAQNVNKDNKVCYVPSTLYYVVIREGSATRNNLTFFLKEPPVRKEICEIINNDFPKAYAKAYKYYIERCLQIVHMQNKKTEARKQAKELFKDALKGLKKVKSISLKERLKYAFIYLRLQ